MASRVQEGGSGIGSSGAGRMKNAKQPAKVKIASRRAAEATEVAKKKRAVVLSLRPNKQNI